MPLVVRLPGVTSHSFARRLEMVSSPVRRAATRERITTAAAGRTQRTKRLLVLADTACELFLGRRLHHLRLSIADRRDSLHRSVQPIRCLTANAGPKHAVPATAR